MNSPKSSTQQEPTILLPSHLAKSDFNRYHVWKYFVVYQMCDPWIKRMPLEEILDVIVVPGYH